MTSTYLIKYAGKLRMLPAKNMNALNANEALAVAVACLDEQRNQLVKDAIDGDKYYYGRRVVEALEVTLTTLEEKYPHIKQHVRVLAFGKNEQN